MQYFQSSSWNSRAPQRPWQTALLVLGLILVFALWFGTRVYIFNHYQRADNPVQHPMTKIFHDMAISMDEGHALGEINVTRIMRNKEVKPTEPYPAEMKDGDEYRQFQTLDPGYGAVYWAARHIFYFIPDTLMRPVMLQLFLDAVILFALYFTFYRWGWLPGVAAGALYSLNIVFAHSAAVPWYYFWDGAVCVIAMIGILKLYRIAHDDDPPRLFLILTAILIGIALGCGVWIRSSWFIFAPILLLSCLFSKTLRPWLIYAFLAYALLAGAMVWRATTLSGELSYSTRMSWHTAFQGLGRHPNPYGFEDNDLYLFDRTQREHGLEYNLTSYAKEDDAMKEDFLALWQKDSGYIVRSISQRIFSNVFFNFNDVQQPFWNQGMLLLAFVGLLFGVWLLGELALISVLSAIMFGALNFGYGFVYYITREYAYATQMLLLFGVVVAVAGMVELARRLYNREWLNFRDTRVNPANIVFAAGAGIMMLLCIPPVQQYLTPDQAISMHWDSPDKVGFIPILGLQYQIDQMPEAERDRFIKFAKSSITKNVDGPPDPGYQFAAQHLRHVTFTNRDGKAGMFWIRQTTDDDAYQALTRATQSILGVGYDWITAFELNDPESWDGKLLKFKLLPNDLLPAERANELLIAKFANWNWELTPLEDGEYIALHTGKDCSDTRRQLSIYFSHQCGDMNGSN